MRMTKEESWRETPSLRKHIDLEGSCLIFLLNGLGNESVRIDVAQILLAIFYIDVNEPVFDD